LAEHRVLLTHDRAPATQRVNRNIPQNLGLCWQNLRLFWQNLGLCWHNIGLFWQNIGLVFHITRHTQLVDAARLQKYPAEHRANLAESRALLAKSRALLADPGLFGQTIGLFWKNLGLFWQNLGVFWQKIARLFYITRRTQLVDAVHLQKYPAEYMALLAEYCALFTHHRAARNKQTQRVHRHVPDKIVGHGDGLCDNW